MIERETISDPRWYIFRLAPLLASLYCDLYRFVNFRADTSRNNETFQISRVLVVEERRKLEPHLTKRIHCGRRSCHDWSHGKRWSSRSRSRLGMDLSLSDEARDGIHVRKRVHSQFLQFPRPPSHTGHETAEQVLTIVVANHWHYAWKSRPWADFVAFCHGHENSLESLSTTAPKVLRYTLTFDKMMIFVPSPSNSESCVFSVTNDHFLRESDYFVIVIETAHW